MTTILALIYLSLYLSISGPGSLVNYWVVANIFLLTSSFQLNFYKTTENPRGEVKLSYFRQFLPLKCIYFLASDFPLSFNVSPFSSSSILILISLTNDLNLLLFKYLLPFSLLSPHS